MLNIRPPSPDRDGFTLIELIIGISLTSILISLVFSIFLTTISTTAMTENQDEIILHGKYALELLVGEVRASDTVVSSNKIIELDELYPSNIGFLLIKDNGVKDNGTIVYNDRYNFTTYYLDGNKLKRIAINKDKPVYPKASDLKGYNEVCDYILSMDGTMIDFNDELLSINLNMGIDDKSYCNFKSTIYLRTKLDY